MSFKIPRGTFSFTPSIQDGESLTTYTRKAYRESLVRVRAARTWCNELGPISVLPPEILAEIFKTVQALTEKSHQLSDLSISSIPYFYQWIRVSHVCSHWRSVALEFASLWARVIVPSSTPLNEAVLARSKRATLDVTADLTVGGEEKIYPLTLVLLNIWRLRSLHLSAPIDKLVQLGNCISEIASAPLLQTLAIRNTTTMSPETLVMLTPPPLQVELDWTRGLETLEIDRYPFPWGVPIPFNGLRHSTVFGLENGLDITQLLQTLKQLPKLETLELQELGPLYSTEELSEAEMVSLGSLRSLHLAASAMNCVCLLGQLRYSANVTLAMSTYFELQAEDVFEQFISFLGSRLSTSRPFAVFSMEMKSHDTFRIRASNGGENILYLELPFSTNRRHFSLRTICEKFSLSQVCVLNLVKLFSDDPPQGWASILGSMQNVEVLYVQDMPIANLIELLERRQMDRKLGRIAYVFPQLYRLRLRGSQITDLSNYKQGGEGKMYAFQDLLIKRRDQGAMLKELILMECVHIRREGVVRLAQVVPHVYWDQVQLVRQPLPERMTSAMQTALYA